ncbi:hypothetical protein LCGC14_0643380 [marine sediment metagenome]|uniref:Uncharacterized protein n=1 Tax=marine sediment metagenome TaxID=412755 RepID=A0A0F9RI04_9ZZZZ
MYTRAQVDAWLGPLTDPTPSRVASEARQMTSQIWTVRRDGRTWAIATDGRSLVMIVGEYGYKDALADGVRKWLASFPKSTRNKLSTTLDALRKWTGPPPDREQVECPKCNSKFLLQWKIDDGVLCGLMIDRRRLAHTLRGCCDEKLTVAAGKGRLVIRSTNMRALLMDTSREEHRDGAPEFKAEG